MHKGGDFEQQKSENLTKTCLTCQSCPFRVVRKKETYCPLGKIDGPWEEKGAEEDYPSYVWVRSWVNIISLPSTKQKERDTFKRLYTRCPLCQPLQREREERTTNSVVTPYPREEVVEWEEWEERRRRQTRYTVLLMGCGWWEQIMKKGTHS